MPSNRDRVIIWGDGAVGTGLAVVLSRSLDVVLMGPPGCGCGRIRLESTGEFSGEATVDKLEAGDDVNGRYSVVAVKAFDLKDVASLAESSTSNRCICLTNGMGLEDEWGHSWNKRVEPAVLTAGFSMVSPDLVDTAPGELVLSSDGFARSVFKDCGIPIEITDNMETVRWAKWLVNSVINPLSALAGVRNNQLRHVGLSSLIERLFRELVQVIPFDYREAAEEEASEMLDFLLSSSGNRSSMLQDINANRRTEIDFLTGLHEKQLPGECPTAAAVTDLVRARVLQLFL
ncbi:MAG: hypothetical protein KAW14_05665 [Candidatus Aegiribacteria sp.]|nr:hypothetical protein [Candidatus Aegiribacteria sp.]